MDRHLQIFLNKVSLISIAIATLVLLILYLQVPDTCVPEGKPTKPHQKFPKSSCEARTRQILSQEKKNQRLWSSKSWKNRVSSYTQFFRSLQDQSLLHNNSKILCVSAGAGHEVMALTEMGVSDVTGVELIESPPLVSRADPHNMPFFNNVFDLAFTMRLEQALLPARFVSEMERTVRRGGVCVVAVEQCGDSEMKEIMGLFKNSTLLGAVNVTLIGSKWTRIIMGVKMP